MKKRFTTMLIATVLLSAFGAATAHAQEPMAGESSFEARDRIAWFSLSMQNLAETDIRVSPIRFEDRGLQETSRCVIKLPLVLEGMAEIMMRFRVIGFEGDSFFIVFDGFINPVFDSEYCAEVVMGLRHIGPDR